MSSTAGNVTSLVDAERQVRIDLAAVHRLADRMQWNDGIYNHFTHTVPGHANRFLVKPHGLLMSEITASNLIVVDMDGKTVAGDGFVETSALHIHAAIHVDIPAAACVLHIHPPYTTWLTCLQDNRLKLTHQAALRFHNRIAYDDEYGGLAMARDEGHRMATKLGNHNVMLHANHGVTTTGASVAHAFADLYDIEKSCRNYYLGVSSGMAQREIPDDIAELTAVQYESEHEQYVELAFKAWKRQLDRDESSYAN
jgi:ribulose-5-phosphate 4-epimerase/fuculose-1-phosphate aldolase